MVRSKIAEVQQPTDQLLTYFRIDTLAVSPRFLESRYGLDDSQMSFGQLRDYIAWSREQVGELGNSRMLPRASLEDRNIAIPDFLPGRRLSPNVLVRVYDAILSDLDSSIRAGKLYNQSVDEIIAKELDRARKQGIPAIEGDGEELDKNKDVPVSGIERVPHYTRAEERAAFRRRNAIKYDIARCCYGTHVGARFLMDTMSSSLGNNRRKSQVFYPAANIRSESDSDKHYITDAKITIRLDRLAVWLGRLENQQIITSLEIVGDEVMPILDGIRLRDSVLYDACKVVKAEYEAVKKKRSKRNTPHAEFLHWSVVTIDQAMADYVEVSKDIMEHNTGLAGAVAKKYRQRGITFTELLHEGIIGIARAVEAFDLSTGYKFSTFATWWIRQAITRYVPGAKRTIRIPDHLLGTVKKIVQFSEAQITSTGVAPSQDELMQMARKLAGSDDTARGALRELRGSPRSLNRHTRTEEGEGSELGDAIEYQNEVTPSDRAAGRDLSSITRDLMSILTKRERCILMLRYGMQTEDEADFYNEMFERNQANMVGSRTKVPLDNVVDGRLVIYPREPYTLEEVGILWGVTRERIRQIENKALLKIRHKVDQLKIDDPFAPKSRDGEDYDAEDVDLIELLRVSGTPALAKRLAGRKLDELTARLYSDLDENARCVFILGNGLQSAEQAAAYNERFDETGANVAQGRYRGRNSNVVDGKVVISDQREYTPYDLSFLLGMPEHEIRRMKDDASIRLHDIALELGILRLAPDGRDVA